MHLLRGLVAVAPILLKPLDEPAGLLRAVGQYGNGFGGVVRGIADGLAGLADGSGHGVGHGLDEVVTAGVSVARDQEFVAVAQSGDVPEGVSPFLGVGVLERGVGALLHKVTDIEGGGRSNQEITIGVPASQVEQSRREAAEIHQHRLVFDDCVGDHELDVFTFTGRHLRFQRSHVTALHVTALVYLGGTVLMRPEFGDAGFGENGIAEEVVVVGVGVDDDERQFRLRPDSIQNLAPLAWTTSGIDDHGTFGTDYQARVQQGSFSDQYIVVCADFEPFRHYFSVPPTKQRSFV